MTKVSLPVALNEPLNALQRSAEMITNMDLIRKMTVSEEVKSDSPESSCFRLICAAVLPVTHLSTNRNRTKKPFNPILGETFEYITPEVRYFSEQVCHHPPVTAFHFEGEGFECESYSSVIQSFKFGGGTGTLDF